MSIFGDLFDFDGDGKESLFEELLGLEVLGFVDTEKDDDEENVLEEEDWL